MSKERFDTSKPTINIGTIGNNKKDGITFEDILRVKNEMKNIKPLPYREILELNKNGVH